MGFNIREASEMAGIKYSTAKTIMQVFNKTGRIERLEDLQELQQ